MKRKFARRPLALALTLVLGASAFPAFAKEIKADALLAIDMNRPAMVEKIVSGWQGQLSAEQEAVVRVALKKMRADRLLAASLTPSLETLLTVIRTEDEGKAIASGVQSKALGDADLEYTPVAPCRLFDTRTDWGGTGPLQVDVERDFSTSGSLIGQGGIPGCNIPTGALAIVMQAGALQPQALGLVQGGAEGAAAYSNAILLYQPGQQYSTSVTLPLNPANGQFTLVARYNGVEAYGDVLGYFNTTTPVAGPTGPTGPAGPTGATGPSGPSGAAGLDGATGPTGPMGVAGPAGAVGPTGAAGANGADGATGPTGATGANGRTVLSGPTGPTGTDGVDGDFWVDTVTAALSGPKAGGIWPAPISLIGPAGAAGATGAQGSTGPAGPTGAQGAAGAAGAQGVPGATGPQGIQGTAGPTGPQGATGPAGATGATGPAGATGAAGSAITAAPIINTGNGNYTVQASDYTVLCNFSGATKNVNLPTAASSLGRIFVIKKIGGSNCDIPLAGVTLGAFGEPNAVTVQSDGTTWQIISHNN